ncbi:hypothetical protein ACLB2K_065028 [Fragaria x ananassa]
MIPTYLLSKLRPYEVQVHGVKVKVTVVPAKSSAAFLNQKLYELRGKRVVGVDVKFQNKAASLLLLCDEGHCLIITIRSHFSNPIFYFSESGLGRLLSNQTICFVYSKFKSETDASYDACLPEMMKKTAGIEVDHLAATVLKKPSLLGKGLHELGPEVGIDIKSAYYDGRSIKWEDVEVFSEEEIIYAIHDVYATFLLGTNFWGRLQLD